jgi:hypothetical protein
MMTTMESFSDRLMAHMNRIGWKPYTLVQRFKDQPKESRLSEQYIYALCRGEKPPKEDEVLRKLASVEGLGLAYETLKAWKVLGSATFEERVALLQELATDEELVPLVRKVIKEKKG